ncbi:F0F1 ATP synthase subunit B [Roseburia sp. 499]|uniref:F0F1 ATP synthase subunit B n=1 Tax=Roseburia sp. 499 TaxID=1261634 RepID=UPI00095174E5|nr:F0F1 ATP synthase subunit B [Roseburia sp. 499]WVK71107.1 F0F1 ATP synthase subunit B [Roseburia sp. 499]
MLSLNVWNLLFTVINVLVLYLLMKKFLFKPVLAVLEKRKEMIASNMEEARKSQQEAEELKTDYEERISVAKEEAQKIVHSARELAEQERAGILEKTRIESEQMIEKAKAAIASEQEKAQQEAKEEIAKLAVLAARKIIEAGDANDTDSY